MLKERRSGHQDRDNQSPIMLLSIARSGPSQAGLDRGQGEADDEVEKKDGVALLQLFQLQLFELLQLLQLLQFL